MSFEYAFLRATVNVVFLNTTDGYSQIVDCVLVDAPCSYIYKKIKITSVN